MITQPALLFVALAGIVALVLRGERTPFGRTVGRFLPVPFWIYFLPMLLGTVGVLPASSPVYDLISRYLLPVAIVMMLIGTSPAALLRMGPVSARAMGLAVVTVFVAQVAAFVILKSHLPADSWKAVGALMGTWIGGSANMVAVKTILDMPDAVLAPLVLVDTVLSYGWMALLLLSAGWQGRFDRGLSLANAEGDIATQEAVSATNTPKRGRWVLEPAIAAVLAILSVWLGAQVAEVAPFLPKAGWALLIASSLAIATAATPIGAATRGGGSGWGSFCLYLVLVTIGARGRLTAAGETSIFFAYGILTFVFHGGLMLVFGRLFRVPLHMLAMASQANIGGAVSAPVVAELYRSGTAHVAVLMAVLGAVLGTYLGVAGGFLCRLLAGGN